MKMKRRNGRKEIIADAVGLDRSFTARIVRLTLLAPDIVETILDGREPDGLSFRGLGGRCSLSGDLSEIPE